MSVTMYVSMTKINAEEFGIYLYPNAADKHAWIASALKENSRR